MKSIAFFNNKGGVGKTTLVYHITHMLAEMGHKCLAVDLDPQSNLTSMFLEDSRLNEIYEAETSRPTILESIKPLNRGIGDVLPAHIEVINDRIGLIPGDLELSLYEDKLSTGWANCLNRDEAAFRIISSFYRIIKEASERWGAEYTLVDIGPNFGAINRAMLISASYVVVPVAADLFSLQGLKNLGNQLSKWKEEWSDRASRNPEPTLFLPAGDIKPLGYVVMQHGVKESRPVKSYVKWLNRIPNVFRQFVMKEPLNKILSITEDIFCLAQLKHYYSLIPMAMEARKPIFQLKPADGAIGAHLGAVKRSHDDFENLTKQMLQSMQF